jgi:hypothetical protein
MRLPLPYHSYELRSTPASPARLVNCYPEVLPAGAKGPITLVRGPGIVDWATVGNGPISAIYTAGITLTTGFETLLYVVSGDELYKVNSSGTATLLGNVGTPNNVDIDSNTSAVVVTNEPHGYYWDGGTFGQIVDDDFVSRGAGDVEFLDDFLLFREPDSGRFFGGDLGSATSFDALQFAIADTAPDQLNGMIADHRQLIAFGTRTTEVWENIGAAGFPFQRIINGMMEVGCLNARTVGRSYNQVLWVADDFTVRRLQGITPARMSTHAIEQKLSTETVQGAFGFDFDGHFFYAVNTDSGTYVLDLVTSEWHERETYGHWNWKPQHFARFAGKRLVADGTSNKIGYLDGDTFTEFGGVQRMEWTYQPVYAEQQRAFHDRLEIVCQTGAGTTTGQGVDPKIMLEYSDDGGDTWKRMPDRSLGPLGKRESRAVWHNLGSARQRVYRAAVSDPVRVSVTDTQIEVRGGRL